MTDKPPVYAQAEYVTRPGSGPALASAIPTPVQPGSNAHSGFGGAETNEFRVNILPVFNRGGIFQNDEHRARVTLAYQLARSLKILTCVVGFFQALSFLLSGAFFFLLNLILLFVGFMGLQKYETGKTWCLVAYFVVDAILNIIMAVQTSWFFVVGFIIDLVVLRYASIFIQCIKTLTDEDRVYLMSPGAVDTLHGSGYYY